MIRDFAKHLVAIDAFANNQPLQLKQISKSSWESEAPVGEIIIEYQIYAFDFSIRGSYLDNQRGFFDGAALLLSIITKKHEPHQIVFIDLPEHWQIATTMPIKATNQFQAKNYESFIDYPFELGEMEILEFTVENIPHRLVLSGNYYDFNRQQLINDVSKICTAEIQFFRQAPFRNYTFLLHVREHAYGGLEHRNSAALLISKECLPQPEDAINKRSQYIELLGLFSHEYFHAWNVKSIKPLVFQPYDLRQESYTELLWAFEGITSFYDDWFLQQSKVISANTYLTLLAKKIDAVYQELGHTKQSVAESSFNAWTKYYKQDENNWNAIVSYYKKGALIAFCLDLYLRQQSNNVFSLHQVMRHLFENYQHNQQGIAERSWEIIAEKLTHVDLTSFMQHYIYGKSPLPLEELFKSIGIEFTRIASKHSNRIVETVPESQPSLDLGIKTRKTPQGLEVVKVLNFSNAEKAGLNPHDLIIAINHFSYQNFQDIWNLITPHSTVIIHFFRDNYLQETRFEVEPEYCTKTFLKILNQTILNRWLMDN